MRKPSTVIFIVLMVPAMLGYIYNGWLLYETITTKHTSVWIRTLFIPSFIFWLLSLSGLLFFAIEFWREKG